MVRITKTTNASIAFSSRIREALGELACNRFEYDLIDHGPVEVEGEEEQIRPFKPTIERTSRLVEAIDLFIHSMEEFNCRYKGEVFFFFSSSISPYCHRF